MNKYYFYKPIAKVSGFQKNVDCIAAEFFTKLPQSMISNINPKVQFKVTLKVYLCKILLVDKYLNFKNYL
jgi:hypothetical protein